MGTMQTNNPTISRTHENQPKEGQVNAFGAGIMKNHNACYKCGDKWVPGHQCKNKQLNALTVGEEPMEPEQTSDLPSELEYIEDSQGVEMMEEAISLNALSGTEFSNTITLNGIAKKRY